MGKKKNSVGEEIHLENLKVFIETRSGLHKWEEFHFVSLDGSNLEGLICSFGLCTVWIMLMSGDLDWISGIWLPF